MRVIHSTGLMLGIERGQLGDTQFYSLKLRGVRLIRRIFETTPAIVPNSQVGHGLEDILDVRSLGVDDIGGNHGHFEAVPADDRNDVRQSPPNAIGLDMTALANGEINSVEADLGGGFSEIFTLKKLKMF